MRITIVGGGPSGLYCGLLLKKANSRHDITIVERNPPGATYGWGVVFSERTLAAFRNADAETEEAIAAHCVRWDTINVRYRGEVIRSAGQPFLAISRKQLLGILGRRCETAGIVLRFGERLTRLSALPPADIVIGADGVHSIVRKTYADAFRPKAERGHTRYVWYGTELGGDAFTFIFRENAHGLFHAHTYPFDATTNTFIVECPEPVWRRARLHQARVADSMAYCERLFRPELGSQRLRSNGSRWSSFVTVTTERWFHKNIVLIGDAAHTAHFSIGSGTRLAMEDALALAQALEQHRSIQAAFHEYEAVRQPAVRAFQQAAGDSQRYFEHLKEYLLLDPLQFAYRLMTRGGRFSHAARALFRHEIHRGSEQARADASAHRPAQPGRSAWMQPEV